MTAANSSFFDRKNCITSDASTPASAATRRIVVAVKPSAAKRARAAVRISCRVVFVPGLRPRRVAGAVAAAGLVCAVMHQNYLPHLELNTC